MSEFQYTLAAFIVAKSKDELLAELKEIMEEISSEPDGDKWRANMNTGPADWDSWREPAGTDKDVFEFRRRYMRLQS